MPTDLQVTLPDATNVGYAEVGDPDGMPVLHLHGTPSSRLEASDSSLREAAENLGVRLIAPDRPGMGLSRFRRVSIVGYAGLVRSFADALELDRFAITAISGGGKYACACAWRLPDRVTRVALVSSTCSFDLPGAKKVWSREDRRAYTLANRAPWVLRLYFAKLRRSVNRDATALLSLFPELGPADKEVLAREDFQQGMQRVMTEAFRQGGRGPAHDLMLEARPWGVPLDEIRVPVEIWHGDDDRIVSPEQSRILARVLPLSTTHFVPGEGHLSLFTKHATELVRSVLSG